MLRTIRSVRGWQFWLTAEHDGTDWKVRILHASTGDVGRFTVSGELSEREAHAEAWGLFPRAKPVEEDEVEEEDAGGVTGLGEDEFTIEEK